MTAKFDLLLSMEETPDGLVGTWEYKSDLFDASSVKQMISHFQTLLEGIVANPGRPLSQLSLLSQAERHQLLFEWNNTQTEYPKIQSIQQLFELQVDRTPEAVAVVVENQPLTYTELNQRANQLAHYLQTQGVGPEMLIGVCLDRSLEMVVALLGILKAGAAYLVLDPTYPRQRLAFMLEETQVSWLLNHHHLAEDLVGPDVSVIHLDADGSLIQQQSTENLDAENLLENLAYVIYTSGSTGNPKGVMVTHNNLINYVQALGPALGILTSDRYLHTASFAFSSSVRQLMLPLCHGATVVVTTDEQRKNPLAAFELIKQRQITVIDIIPSYWRSCTHLLSQLDGLVRTHLLDNQLRLILSASEPLPSVLPTTWRFGFKHGARLINMYGQTETSGIACVYPIPDDYSEAGKIVPIGRPIANSQIFILDRQLNPVPMGLSGELYIGSPSLARGYFQTSELTAKRFIPNPFSPDPNARLYNTGDLARYRADGAIEFLGRLDHPGQNSRLQN